MIPAWLQRQHNEGGTRAVTLRLCARCRATILFGLDADSCGLIVRVDPVPINEKGEAFALLTGRTTYDLTGDKRRKTLDPRHARHIEKSRRHLVFAQHQCGKSLQQFAAAPPARKEPDDDYIPF